MTTKRDITLLLLALLGFIWTVACFQSVQQPPSLKKLKSAKALAEKLELIAEPDYPGRYYNHSNQAEEGPTITWLLKRRAFSPLEVVTLRFRLPEGIQADTSLGLKVAITLHDINGTKRQDIGEVLARQLFFSWRDQFEAVG